MNGEKDEKIARKFISTSGPAKVRTTRTVDKDDDDESLLENSEPRPKPSGPKCSKGKSLFAQRMEEKKLRRNLGSTTSRSREPADKTEEINELMRRQGVIDKGQNVSCQDILKMREEFLGSLSQETRQLLLGRVGKGQGRGMAKSNKERKGPEENVARRMAHDDEDSKEGATTTSEIVAGRLPINPEEFKEFPHMETVEVEKLSWTLEPESKGTQSSPTEIQARFDMNGNVIDARSASEKTWVQGLHHHGDEMDKPGYTFEELLIYSRSTVVSQRAFALSAIAAIFRNAHEGVYDSALNINPLALLSNVDVMCALRKSLDWEDKVTLDAALACLSAVLFSSTEEECFDVAYLFPESAPLSLCIPDVKKSMADDETMRDHQVLKSDLILFLIGRAKLLDRMEYLLADRPDRLSESGTIIGLEILIRIARHSPEALLAHKKLLENLHKMVTSNWAAISAGSTQVVGNPVAIKNLMIMKIWRLIVQSSPANAKILHDRYQPMSNVLTYLASHSQFTSECCCHAKLLILETFRFWSSSVKAGLGISEFSVMFPTLTMNLRYFCEPEALKSVVSFDGYYLTQVFNFLFNLLLLGERDGRAQAREDAWNLVKDLEYFVVTITMQVLQILATTREDWTLALASKGLELITIAMKWGKLKHRSSAILDHVKQLDLTRVARSLKNHSLLLNLSTLRTRCPANFASSGAVLSSCKVNPIVAQQSPFQFYKPWVEFLQVLNHAEMAFTSEVKDYLESLGQIKNVEYLETYFIRFEQSLVHKLLSQMDVQSVNITVPIHLICTLCKSNITAFANLLMLISERVDPGKSDILELYMACYFPGVKIESNLGESEEEEEEDADDTVEVERGERPICVSEKALVNGKFWMLEPIRKLVTRYASNRKDLQCNFEAVVREAKICLSLVLFVLKESSFFSTLEDTIECYVFVSQIFSLGEEVFMDTRIEDTLQDILRLFVISLSQTDLTKHPEPFTKFESVSAQITTFKDYYRDLVKEFESLSYCSDTFSAYLMFPLLPTESREIKLLFWSMQGLQFVHIPLENDLIPLEYFTKTVETDRALIQLYTLLLKRTNTITQDKHGLLFAILDHHLLHSDFAQDSQK